MTSSPSMTVGTSPFGLSFRYSGARLPPKEPPWSTRSNARSSSAQHHSTFWTFDELARPQIFSIEDPPADAIWSPRFLASATTAPDPAILSRDDQDRARPCSSRARPGGLVGRQPAGHRDDQKLED